MESSSKGVRTAILHVGNLSFQATKEQLRAHFKKHGEVLQIRIPRHPDGSPKGYAFIEMGSPDQADEAIRKAHGLPFLEREGLQVQLAHEKGNPRKAKHEKTGPKKANPGNPGKLRNARSPEPGTTRTLFFGNLDFSIGEGEMKHFLKDFEVESVRIVHDSRTGHHKGCAFAVLKDPQEALNAKQKLEGGMIKDRPVRLHHAEDMKKS